MSSTYLAEDDLPSLRLKLDDLTIRLIMRLASLWQLNPYRLATEPPTSEALHDLTETQRKVAFLRELYAQIGRQLNNSKLQHTFLHMNGRSRAVRRILSGSDFPTEQGQTRGLDEMRYWMLAQLLDPSHSKVIELIGERCQVIERVGLYKRRYQEPMRNPEREQEILKQAEGLAAQYDLPMGVLQALFECILFPIAFEIEELLLAEEA